MRRSGMGLHGGKSCAVTLLPAPAGSGRVFVREGARIPATIAHVTDSRRATTLGAEGASVGMVEHLLAALLIAGIDDAEILVEGEEIPLLDGCARAWTEAIAEAGVVRAEAPAPVLQLQVSLAVRLGEGFARAGPGAPRAEVHVDFPHPAIGAQRWSGLDPTELLDARTFGFLAEQEALSAKGLAAGALAGARAGAILVYGPEGPLTPPRGTDEPVRHKGLDLLGDLALLGRRLLGTVEVSRGGHALHHALVRALDSAPSRGEDALVPLEVR